MKYHLRAFTITELMAVALISTITVTAAFSAYRIIDTQFREYGKDNEKAFEISTLKGLLSNDFLQATKVLKYGDGLRFNTGTDSITYSFLENYIIRENTNLDVRNDTFHVKIEESIFKLNRMAVEIGLIDFAMLKVQLTPASKSNLSFSKKYSSADLFEYYGSQD